MMSYYVFMSEALASLILRIGFVRDVGLAAGKVKAAARREDVELVEGAREEIYGLGVVLLEAKRPKAKLPKTELRQIEFVALN